MLTMFSRRSAIDPIRTITRIAPHCMPPSMDMKKLLINALSKGTEDVIKQFHRKTMFLEILHSQNLYNIDLERVQRCGIHYANSRREDDPVLQLQLAAQRRN